MEIATRSIDADGIHGFRQGFEFHVLDRTLPFRMTPVPDSSDCRHQGLIRQTREFCGGRGFFSDVFEIRKSFDVAQEVIP